MSDNKTMSASEIDDLFLLQADELEAAVSGMAQRVGVPSQKATESDDDFLLQDDELMEMARVGLDDDPPIAIPIPNPTPPMPKPAPNPGPAPSTPKPKPQAAATPQREVTVNPASFAELRSPQTPQKETASLDMLLDIGLQVTVELGRAKMNIRDILTVGPGTVVELNRVAGEPVDILINGKLIAKGEVVVIGDMFGVRVVDILPPAQRVQSMI